MLSRSKYIGKKEHRKITQREMIDNRKQTIKKTKKCANETRNGKFEWEVEVGDDHYS